MSVNHGEAGGGSSSGEGPRRGHAAGGELRFPEEAPPERGGRDWRDTFRGATDLALVGFLTCLGALAGVTAAAAVGTASAAIAQWCEYETWPSARETLRRFGRAVLPGVPVSLIVIVVGSLLAINVRALATGVVPGGPVLIGVTRVVAAAAAGYAGLVTVAIGRSEARGWRTAARAAARTAQARPGVPAALAGVLAIGAVLLVMVHPLIIPILAGYLLFGLHAVSRRLAA